MSQETLLTAARRLLRNVTVDSETHGGLLSRESLKSGELLRAQILAEERRQRRAPPTDDATVEPVRPSPAPAGAEVAAE